MPTMPYDEALAARVRRALMSAPSITERKMMGALCFMTSGNMFCSVTGFALMIRIGAHAYAEAVGQHGVGPMAIAGRAMKAFVLIDPDISQSDAALVEWVNRGLNFAATLPPKR